MLFFDRDVLIPKEPIEIAINVGYLEPGFYRITENEEMSHLMKEQVGFIDDISQNKIPCKFRAVFDPETPSFRRYGFIHKKTNYSYHLKLWSREAYLKEHPTLDTVDRNNLSFYVNNFNESEYNGYPNCKFIQDISPSGIYRFRFSLEKVGDIPND